MSFKDKYLKYKGKDSSFKNLTGGAVAPVVPAPNNGFVPNLDRGDLTTVVEKIGRRDIIMSPNFQDLCVWDPPRLYEGVHFSLTEPWKNNNNNPVFGNVPRTLTDDNVEPVIIGGTRIWADVTLIRDVYLTVNNKKFKIKSGTLVHAFTLKHSPVDISKIIFSPYDIEFVSESVPESACVVQ
jgi:hypothetical protein